MSAVDRSLSRTYPASSAFTKSATTTASVVPATTAMVSVARRCVMVRDVSVMTWSSSARTEATTVRTESIVLRPRSSAATRAKVSLCVDRAAAATWRRSAIRAATRGGNKSISARSALAAGVNTCNESRSCRIAASSTVGAWVPASPVNKEMRWALSRSVSRCRISASRLLTAFASATASVADRDATRSHWSRGAAQRNQQGGQSDRRHSPPPADRSVSHDALHVGEPARAGWPAACIGRHPEVTRCVLCTKYVISDLRVGSACLVPNL